MEPNNSGNQSPDVDQLLILAAIKRSTLRGPLGQDRHEIDSHFGDLNHVITKSRAQTAGRGHKLGEVAHKGPRRGCGGDKGPCMVLRLDTGARRIRTSRSNSPENDFGSKKSRYDRSDDSDDDVMIITPRTARKEIPSDSDDDDPRGNYGSDSEDDEDLKDLFKDDAHFCDFANDNYKCYRNSLLQVLLSCDMLLQAIRTHKQKPSLPPCSEFDDFVLQLYDRSQRLNDMSIDAEFRNSPCLHVKIPSIDSSYPEQSPTDYIDSMFKECGNRTHVIKELMSYRMLNSIQRSYCDGTITWRTNMHKNVIFSEACAVIDETGFNNVRENPTEASGVNLEGVATMISIAIKLPKIWCIDCANNYKHIIFHPQFTLSIPQMDGNVKLERAVYQIIGCVSRSESPRHYVACIFKNHQWVCMVCLKPFIQFFRIYTVY